MGNCNTNPPGKATTQSDFSSVGTIRSRSDSVDMENEATPPNMRMINTTDSKLTKRPGYKINLNNLDKAVKYNDGGRGSSLGSNSQRISDSSRSERLINQNNYPARDPPYRQGSELDFQNFKRDNSKPYSRSSSLNEPSHNSPHLPSDNTNLKSSQIGLQANPSSSSYVSFNPNSYYNPDMQGSGYKTGQFGSGSKVSPSKNNQVVQHENYRHGSNVNPFDVEKRSLETMTLSSEPRGSVLSNGSDTKLRRIVLKPKAAQKGDITGSFEGIESMLGVQNHGNHGMTLPPRTNHFMQSGYYNPTSNLPPPGPSANSYARSVTPDRKLPTSGQHTHKQHRLLYSHSQTLKRDRTSSPFDGPNSQNTSGDEYKFGYASPLLNGNMVYGALSNPFQDSNNVSQASIGKEYTKELLRGISMNNTSNSSAIFKENNLSEIIPNNFSQNPLFDSNPDKKPLEDIFWRNLSLKDNRINSSEKTIDDSIKINLMNNKEDSHYFTLSQNLQFNKDSNTMNFSKEFKQNDFSKTDYSPLRGLNSNNMNFNKDFKAATTDFSKTDYIPFKNTNIFLLPTETKEQNPPSRSQTFSQTQPIQGFKIDTALSQKVDDILRRANDMNFKETKQPESQANPISFDSEPKAKEYDYRIPEAIKRNNVFISAPSSPTSVDRFSSEDPNFKQEKEPQRVLYVDSRKNSPTSKQEELENPSQFHNFFKKEKEEMKEDKLDEDLIRESLVIGKLIPIRGSGTFGQLDEQSDHGSRKSKDSKIEKQSQPTPQHRSESSEPKISTVTKGNKRDIPSMKLSTDKLQKNTRVKSTLHESVVSPFIQDINKKIAQFSQLFAGATDGETTERSDATSQPHITERPTVQARNMEIRVSDFESRDGELTDRKRPSIKDQREYSSKEGSHKDHVSSIRRAESSKAFTSVTRFQRSDDEDTRSHNVFVPSDKERSPQKGPSLKPEKFDSSPKKSQELPLSNSRVQVSRAETSSQLDASNPDRLVEVQQMFLNKINNIHHEILEKINNIGKNEEKKEINFSNLLGSQDPSAQNSPTHKHLIPSLNVSEIQKIKFFDDKEWSQQVSPLAELTLENNQSNPQINQSNNSRSDRAKEEFREEAPRQQEARLKHAKTTTGIFNLPSSMFRSEEDEVKSSDGELYDSLPKKSERTQRHANTWGYDPKEYGSGSKSHRQETQQAIAPLAQFIKEQQQQHQQQRSTLKHISFSASQTLTQTQTQTQTVEVKKVTTETNTNTTESTNIFKLQSKTVEEKTPAKENVINPYKKNTNPNNIFIPHTQVQHEERSAQTDPVEEQRSLSPFRREAGTNTTHELAEVIVPVKVTRGQQTTPKTSETQVQANKFTSFSTKDKSITKDEQVRSRGTARDASTDMSINNEQFRSSLGFQTRQPRPKNQLFDDTSFNTADVESRLREEDKSQKKIDEVDSSVTTTSTVHQPRIIPRITTHHPKVNSRGAMTARTTTPDLGIKISQPTIETKSTANSYRESTEKKHSNPVVEKKEPPMTERQNYRERVERLNSISERNFTLGEGSEPPQKDLISNSDIETQKFGNFGKIELRESRTSLGSTLPAFGKRYNTSHRLTESNRNSPLVHPVGLPESGPETNTSIKPAEFTDYHKARQKKLQNKYATGSGPESVDDYHTHEKSINEKKTPMRATKYETEDYVNSDYYTSSKRIATSESEKKELYERLANSPFIKKQELETPEDLSCRMEHEVKEKENSDITEEDKEKQFHEQLSKIKEKVKDFNDLAKFLMSSPFRKFAEKQSQHNHYNPDRRQSSGKKKKQDRDSKSPMRDTQPVVKKEKNVTPKKYKTKSNIILENLNYLDTDKKQMQENERNLFNQPRIEKNARDEYVSSSSSKRSLLQESNINYKSSSSLKPWNDIQRDILQEDDYNRVHVKGIHTPKKISFCERRKNSPLKYR